MTTPPSPSVPKPATNPPNKPATPLLDTFAANRPDSHVFRDTFTSELKRDDIADIDAMHMAFFEGMPQWIGVLMTIRNKLVGRLGFDTGSNSPEKLPEHPMPGDAVGVFTVHGRSDTELLIGNDDDHITFRVSLILENKRLGATTVAYANSKLGKAYLRFIQPFHRQVVKATVRNSARARQPG